MITRICGKLSSLHEERILLEVGNFEYEIFVTSHTSRRLRESLGQEIKLYTIEYLDGNQVQGRFTPRMIGFSSEVEREFFEVFCTVDGIGVKKALQAMVWPVRDIASAIAESSIDLLCGLPGVSKQTAERIVAKLKRKMPKFALMVPLAETGEEPQSDVVTETFDALIALGYSESEARRLIDGVLKDSRKKYKDSGDLIKEIYMSTR